ncbi:MAG: hypothetical protein M3Z04_19125 [Chloroflexota bacterium]|nr:hypothetical protein [Chloroflexota bacterium]
MNAPAHGGPAIRFRRLRYGVGGLTAALGLLLLVGCGQAVAAFAANAQQWLPYPYPRPGSEGLMLYETLLLRAGGDLYGPITAERFISGPYPPVYYWLAGRVMPATPGFFDGRSLSLWAALAVAALIILIVATDRRERHTDPSPNPSPKGGGELDGNDSLALVGEAHAAASPTNATRNTQHATRNTAGRWGGRAILGLAAGVAAAGLWLACPPVLIWSTRFRADMLMLACQTAGLACLVLGARSSRSHGATEKEQEVSNPQSNQSAFRIPHSAFVWLAIPCFVLALYTKQTALAGPLGGAAWLLVRDWRQGLRWIAALGALGGGIFLALDVATGHGFYGKMIVYHSLPWSAPTFTRLLTAWAEDHWPLIAVALGYLAWAAWTRRNRPVVWYIAAALATLPTAGVVGADSNHLLAVDLALALATGSVLAGGPWAVGRGPWAVGRGPWAVGRGPWAVGGRRLSASDSLPLRNTQYVSRFTFHVSRFTLYVATLAAGLAFLQLAASPATWYAADLTMPDAEKQNQLRQIVELVRSSPPGSYFADDPGILALAGKTTAYDDPFTMTALAAAGRWDAGAFTAQLRGGQFPLLVLDGDPVSDPPGRPLRSDILTPAMRAALRAGYRVLYRDVLFTYVPK